MRVFILFFLVLNVVSCKAKDQVSQVKDEEKIQNYCPDDGTCTINVLTQKSFNVKRDNLGAIYLDIAEGNKIVLKFEAFMMILTI